MCGVCKTIKDYALYMWSIFRNIDDEIARISQVEESTIIAYPNITEKGIYERFIDWCADNLGKRNKGSDRCLFGR